jgi:hypothetical protein
VTRRAGKSTFDEQKTFLQLGADLAVLLKKAETSSKEDSK